MTRIPPIVEIVSTGTEILQGLYADRNAQDLSRLLDAAGFRVRHHHAARDHVGELRALLDVIAARADAIVMTGGLGPTDDDVNRDVIADIWNAPTELDPEAERMVRKFFEHRGLPMPERNVVQAMIPRGATVFYNFHGTAPGFGIPPAANGEELGRRARAALVALPGPPREWKAMWERDAGPWLCSRFPDRPLRRIECLHVAMIPESTINERLHDLFNADPRVELTLLADRGHIRIRLILTTDSEGDGERLAAEYVARVRERLPAEALLSGRESAWSLEEEINDLLRNGSRRIATAESCTGGLVAARITDVAGASAYFHQGFVTYSNEAKSELLGVREITLREHGAVSRECALEMAAGARRRTAADAALSITGVAGPGGGTEEKPVGTVWFAMDTADRGVMSIRRRLPGNRDNVREWACRQGLDLIRRWAASLPWPE